jgi:hypothetical protein
MSDIILQKVSKKDLDKAQAMFFNNYELSTIASVLSIEPETLRFYVFGLSGNGTEKDSWHGIKKTLKNTAMTMFLKDKAGSLEKTCGMAIEIVSDSLAQLRDELVSGEREPLTIDEIGKLAKVSVDMDKMYRLEAGIATELVEHMGLSRAEAREILASDPFAPRDIEVESIQTLPWLEEKNE